MDSWRGFCPVFSNVIIRPHEFLATILTCFFAHKIRHYEFMATILSCFFQWHNSSTLIRHYQIMAMFCRVFLADKICPHKFMATILSCFFAHKIRHYEFMATVLSCFFANKIRHYGFMTMILSCYFRLQNSSSWIHGDDLVLSFSITKFVIMNSWRRFCRVFLVNKIRHHEFMARILSCFFKWQNSSTWIHGDDFVLFFR